jgi:hypothetical protein
MEKVCKFHLKHVAILTFHDWHSIYRVSNFCLIFVHKKSYTPFIKFVIYLQGKIYYGGVENK